MFANPDNLRLPINGTVCRACGLVQGEGRALDELRIGYVLTVILGVLRSIFSDLVINPNLCKLT